MRKKFYVAAIVLTTLSVSFLHYWETSETQVLHTIYLELYYIPVLIAAFAFGLRGAIPTYILIVLLYLPYALIFKTETILSLANKLTHIFLIGFFALLFGFLVDRDRRLRGESEKARYLAGLGQAAAAIVHELKNPLITITGFARRIREGKGDVAAGVRTIEESAEAMQEIVADVLDFAKPAKLSPRRQDIRGVVRKACDTCRAKAEKAGVALSLNLPDGPLDAPVDALSLERAIVNFIDNGVDASKRGQVVTISAGLSEKDAITVRVRDDGMGMDKETLENVFIPFYTRKSAGTGLGMAIAKKIIEEHRGGLRIKSRPAEGTEVTITLRQKE